MMLVVKFAPMYIALLQATSSDLPAREGYLLLGGIVRTAIESDMVLFHDTFPLALDKIELRLDVFS